MNIPHHDYLAIGLGVVITVAVGYYFYSKSAATNTATNTAASSANTAAQQAAQQTAALLGLMQGSVSGSGNVTNAANSISTPVSASGAPVSASSAPASSTSISLSGVPAYAASNTQQALNTSAYVSTSNGNMTTSIPTSSAQAAQQAYAAIAGDTALVSASGAQQSVGQQTTGANIVGGGSGGISTQVTCYSGQLYDASTGIPLNLGCTG